MQVKNFFKIEDSPAVTAVVGMVTKLILGLHPTNERRRYVVTTSLIGWV